MKKQIDSFIYIFVFYLILNCIYCEEFEDKIIDGTGDANSVYPRRKAFALYDLRSEAEKKVNTVTKKVTVIGNVAYPGIYLITESITNYKLGLEALFFMRDKFFIIIYHNNNKIEEVSTEEFKTTFSKSHPQDGDVYDVK